MKHSKLTLIAILFCCFFFQAEDGIRDYKVTGVQTCALPISVHFFAVRPTRPNENELKSLSNLELLRGDQYCIDCRAASFDKVICSLALHPLRQDKKLALLKEMRRVLRHGGALYLADFDKPLRPTEIHALRGTGYLFGPDTAKSHTD